MKIVTSEGYDKKLVEIRVSQSQNLANIGEHEAVSILRPFFT